MEQFSFWFLTDTHLGNDGTGWGHHPIRPDLMPRLITALTRRLEKQPVNMLLHGGDITDSGTSEQQLQAGSLWSRLPVPTRLCLGNHDVTDADAPQRWLIHAPDFFPGSQTDYLIECGPADLYVLAGAWLDEDGNPSPWWNRCLPDRPAVLPEQLSWLDRTLSARPERPALLAVHAALDPLPAALTGLNEPTHVPPTSFAAPLLALLQRHPNVKLVLSGHCHATCRTDHKGRVHLTTSAFCEPPFQVRAVLVTDAAVSIRTFTPLDYQELQVVFRPENAWSAGRPGDLTVDIPLSRSRCPDVV